MHRKGRKNAAAVSLLLLRKFNERVIRGDCIADVKMCIVGMPVGHGFDTNARPDF